MAKIGGNVFYLSSIVMTYISKHAGQHSMNNSRQCPANFARVGDLVLVEVEEGGDRDRKIEV